MRWLGVAFFGALVILQTYVLAMLVRPELRAADRWPTRTWPVQQLIRFSRWVLR